MRRTLIALWICALTVGAVWVALTWRDNQDLQARQRAGAKAQAAASSAVEEMFSYRAGELANEIEAEAGLLTPDFAKKYTSLITTKIVPEATRQKLATQATVSAGSVIDGGRTRVECLLFVNIHTRVGTTDGATSGSRLVLSMKRVSGRWLVAGIRAV